MENTFLENLVSSALFAQDAQESQNASDESMISEATSIKESDGYVGEMVKACLNLFEESAPDKSRVFSDEYLLILDHYEMGDDADRWETFEVQKSFSSIAELESLLGATDIHNFAWVEDNKFYAKSRLFDMYLYIDAYRILNPNDLLRFPRKGI